MIINQIIISINSETDIIAARQNARVLGKSAGFNISELAAIATAISELAQNIIAFAPLGEITLQLLTESNQKGMRIIAIDSGPGIEDVDLAMKQGYSTKENLGIGLPGVRRLMDNFKIKSEKGKGTIVIAEKWILYKKSRVPAYDI